MANPYLKYANQGNTNPYLKYSGGATTTRKTVDLENIDDLKKFAVSKGLEVKEKKPSLFRRGIDLLSRANYASAGAAKALIKGENPLAEAWKGLTGKEKETYSDVLGEAGVKNKYVKGIVGFALDVALDPTTYYGGTIMKGAGKLAKGTAKTALKAIPESSAIKLVDAATNLKDAFGYAFKWDYKTTGDLSNKAMQTINKMAMAKEGIITKGLERFKGAKPEQVKRAVDLIIHNRRVELGKAGREGFEAFADKSIRYAQNPETNRLLKVMKDWGGELGQKSGLDKAGIAQKWYFPFIDEKFLKAGGGKIGGMAVSDKGYSKLVKNLIQDDNLLKKPVEAYTRTEYKIVRDKMVQDTMNDMIGSYGKNLKAFKSSKDAIKNGYVLIKDKLYGKKLGYLKAEDAKFLDNVFHPEMKTLDNLVKASGYDKLTNWFKTAVTAYFPAFHVRNYLSGNIQNYQVLGASAFLPANHNTALGIVRALSDNVADKAVKIGKYQTTTKALANVMKENFGGASRYISDIGSYIDEVADGTFKVARDPGRAVGNLIEMNQKAVAMVAALRKGHSLDDAVKLAEKAGFNYAKITQFEAKVMKRLIPFYTFARKNAELQLNTLAKNPERVVNLSKAATALGNIFGEKTTEEDLKGLPEWATEGLGFKIKDGKFLTNFGIPLEEFTNRVNNPIMSTLTSLNPILKYPIESKLGYDFFREQQIIDVNKISPTSGELLWKAKESGLLPDWFQEAFNLNRYKSKYDGKMKYTMSPKALHVLRNLPTSRLQNTLEKLFDNDLDSVNKWTGFLSGGKIYDINIEEQKYFQERDLRRDIEDQLLNRGIGTQTENFWVYK
jgi:hypothetical protein